MWTHSVALKLFLLVALALPAGFLPGDAARAGNDPYHTGPQAGSHRSVMYINAADGFPQHKTARIGKNKALLVEMPRDMRDVMVSAPEIVDAVVQSSRRIHLIGKKYGQSNAFFFDSNGRQVLTLEITVEHDTTVLDGLLARLIPGSNIHTEILNETVILTGTVRTPADSSRARDVASRFIVAPNAEDNRRDTQKVINLLSVEGEEQVMLKVVVAEVQRELLKQMGVNLAAAVNAGNFGIGLLTANALPLTAAAGLGTLPVPGISTAVDPQNLCAGITCFYNTGPSGTFGNSGTNQTWAAGNASIDSAIRALERDGFVQTLAEPNLTAISGEAAKFHVGGEYPIPVVDATGQTTVEYREFGIKVAFTPFVLSEGRISLKIESEVSELSNAGAVTLSSISIPALKKRQANSTVELPSGGSLALAGLISDDVRQNIDGLPGLKDMPVLGTLFRSRDFIRRETELVVIVTPYLVRPVAQRALAKPTDGLAPATDRNANFMGHLNVIYGGGGRDYPTGDLKGDYGFIVE